MNRRRFCGQVAALGGAVALAPLVQACDRWSAPAAPQPTAPPSPEPVAATAAAPSPAPGATPAASLSAAGPVGAVALVHTTDRADGVRRAIELLGINPVRGRAVLLKPNFNSADPPPGSTHDEVVRALLAGLADMGAGAITIADRSGMGDTPQVMRAKGVPDLAKAFGAATLALEDLSDDAWQVMHAEGEHWSRGFPVPRLLLDAECVVQTCNLKTHRHGGHFTLSLKNSVGLVAKHHGGYNYMTELHAGADQRRMIAEVNTTYTPALVVLDGVEAFVKGGPDTGTRAATEVVLAGTDRVALDAVGVAILRLFGSTAEVSRGRVFEQEQLARAVALGLGVPAPEHITLVTGDPASAAYAERVRPVLLA